MNVAESLLHQVARGDQAAMTALLDKYGGLVFALARRFSFDPGEIDDAVQDVFVAVWKSAGRYDPAIAGEDTFVAMVARRRLIDRRRRTARRQKGEVAADVTAMGDGRAQSQQEGVELSEQARRAAELLGTLRPEQQQVLRLSICQGYSHDQIARTLNLPLGTVKTHVRRGLIALREAMQPKAANTRSERVD